MVLELPVHGEPESFPEQEHYRNRIDSCDQDIRVWSWWLTDWTERVGQRVRRMD